MSRNWRTLGAALGGICWVGEDYAFCMVWNWAGCELGCAGCELEAFGIGLVLREWTGERGASFFMPRAAGIQPPPPIPQPQQPPQSRPSTSTLLNLKIYILIPPNRPAFPPQHSLINPLNPPNWNVTAHHRLHSILAYNLSRLLVPASHRTERAIEAQLHTAK